MERKKGISKGLHLLVSEQRLKILQMLQLKRAERLNVNELAGRLGIPATTLSCNLRELKALDLVWAEKQGTEHYYRVDEERVADLLYEVMSALHLEQMVLSRCS